MVKRCQNKKIRALTFWPKRLCCVRGIFVNKIWCGLVHIASNIASSKVLFLPSKTSWMAIVTPLSKALASAAVWKVIPYLLLPVFQWWKVGITLLYSKSRLIVQVRITCRRKSKKLIIGWEVGFRAWGHLGSGPKCGTGSKGQYKNHPRGRSRARFWWISMQSISERVTIKLVLIDSSQMPTGTWGSFSISWLKSKYYLNHSC